MTSHIKLKSQSSSIEKSLTKNVNIIIINHDNIEMEIGRNYFRERLNFIIGMVCVIILLIAIVFVKAFLL